MNHKTIVRIILFLLAFMIIFSCVYSVFAAELEEEDITAPSVILIDADTGSVLYEKNADEQRAPASTTKLLTVILAMENLHLDDEITVPPEAQTGGSLMGLKPGQVVTVETLLYGLMLSSGNDAAVTLAVAISGSVEAFADKMNERAAELGMTNSHFVTASGLDAEGHYVSVRDMAIVARYAYRLEILRTIMLTQQKTLYTTDKSVSFQLENTNMLVHTPTKDGNGDPYTGPSFLYEYATGMKTGSTVGAGGCLVASAEKDGLKLIAVIFGDKSEGERDRWTIAAKLFDYGFANYRRVSLLELLGEPIELEVAGGPIINGEAAKLPCIPFTQQGIEALTLPIEADLSSVKYVVTPNSAALNAPIQENAVVGEILITLGGEVLLKGDLVAEEAMMTTEEYAKLSGTQAELADLLNLDTEKRENLRKYAWLWLLLPFGVIAFLIWRGLWSNRSSGRRYREPAMIGPRTALPRARARGNPSYRRQNRPTGKPPVRQGGLRRSKPSGLASLSKKRALRRSAAMRRARQTVRRPHR